MKQLVTSLAILSSLSGLEFNKNYGSEFEIKDSHADIRPFVSLDYNIIAVDEIDEDNTYTLSLSAGWIYSNDNRFMLTAFRDKKKLNAKDTLTFENIGFFYEKSLNTQGENKGFYIGAGINKNNFTEKKYSDGNETGSLSTFHQIDTVVRVGYEYKVEDNILYDFSVSGTLFPITQSLKDENNNMYYSRFSVKYLFTKY
jgi:hypothetical protein